MFFLFLGLSLSGDSCLLAMSMLPFFVKTYFTSDCCQRIKDDFFTSNLSLSYEIYYLGMI